MPLVHHDSSAGHTSHNGSNGLSDMAGTSECYWCRRTLVAVVIPSAFLRAWYKRQMQCAACTRRGLPNYKPGDPAHNLRRGYRRATLKREGRWPIPTGVLQ